MFSPIQGERAKVDVTSGHPVFTYPPFVFPGTPDNDSWDCHIGLGRLSLGLQVPPQKVFGPSKPTPNTFLEGPWSPRVYERDQVLVVSAISAPTPHRSSMPTKAGPWSVSMNYPPNRETWYTAMLTTPYMWRDICQLAC